MDETLDPDRRVYRMKSQPSPARKFGLLGLAVFAFLFFIGAHWAASLFIQYNWWREVGQVGTWINLYAYSTLPVLLGAVLAWVCLLLAHSRGMHFAGGRVGDYPIYSRIAALGLLAVAFIVSEANIDGWNVLRFVGSRGVSATGTYHDPIFGKSTAFYLFDLPFWSDIRGYIFGLVIVTILVYWVTARGWQLRFVLPDLPKEGFDLSILHLPGGLESTFLRFATVLLLVSLAVRYYLSRFEMVWNHHRFMTGVDYTDDHFALPLYWVVIGAMLVASGLVLLNRWVLAGAIAGGSLVLLFVVPSLAGSLIVKPNEISLERPYIQSHIAATRTAWGLSGRVKETQVKTNPNGPIDVAKNSVQLDNVRLWDWRPFHDTVTQMQALRPYYAFHDTDVDRYTIDGEYRQVMLSPRELDITQLPGSQSSWINPHFIYTHGYGLVFAEVSKLTPEGQPVYLIQDMPPTVTPKSLKVERPELYFGELQHEPVFVETAQQEFNYPQGSENALSRYDGKGGFPASSVITRLAASLHFGDWNILLTNYLTDKSRMMIHRRVRERLETMAPYLTWDNDPYLVLSPEGRMIWMVDGYTTSRSHPFSRLSTAFNGTNYIRNSVKATVDAYDGTTHLYVFDDKDPIIAAYRTLFPALFEDAAKMPAAIREHARYPEDLFRAQSEIYRIYHMRNPQAFYNNEDIWELSTYSSGNSEPRPVTPTYVFAELPGETKPEFLLMTTFTPLSKQNLIGVMLARCDGPHLGEIVVLEMSKQELVLGPMQINARINQDEVISKDLTLWNQQGSQILQGQTLVLPVDDNFVYISPLYLQATQARIPQLKKVVLAVGNRLIYTDTYEEALAILGGGTRPPAAAPGGTPALVQAAGGPAQPVVVTDPRIENARRHFQRYRELTSQGKWAEAGKELDALQAELNK